MSHQQVIEFKERLDKLVLQADEMESDLFEEEVLKLEEEILEMDGFFQGKDEIQISKILKKITSVKKEYEFYNEQDTLDIMFPNRHDDDFDEDSMSYDSVFGDE